MKQSKELTKRLKEVKRLNKLRFIELKNRIFKTMIEWEEYHLLKSKFGSKK